jgi:hypothetical protein
MAEAAFAAAADPTKFPEQLEYVDPWQPKRLYFNASSWWNKDIAERAKNSPDFVTVNVGKYNPLLGETYSQIASRSRSEHKSQGFGSDYSYGLNVEYMEYVIGDKAAPEKGILDGVERSWNRAGAPEIASIMQTALDEFDINAPENTAQRIVDALEILDKMADSPLKSYKTKELESLVLDLMGLRVEANTGASFFTRGDQMPIMINAVMQSDLPLTIESAGIKSVRNIENIALKNGELFAEEIVYNVPESESFSNPYWLNKPYDALYNVDGFDILGIPENKAAVIVDMAIATMGRTFKIQIPVKQKVVDPVKAVMYAPAVILPQVTFNFSEDIIISSGTAESKQIIISVQNHAANSKGRIALKLPEGWSSSPEFVEYSSSARGETQKVPFTLIPSKGAYSGSIDVTFQNENTSNTRTQSLQVIEYDHIPKQIILKNATAELKTIDLNRGNVNLVGYLDGPGDDVAKYLRAAGYNVVNLTPQDALSQDLGKYDAIVSGIRIYNTLDEMAYTNNALNEYVKEGGTYIVQYNTSRGVKSENIGPYDFEISRERVTNENAGVRFINPNHRALNHPNKIGNLDFDNWVQERGLYFAGSWDSAFEPILSWSDPEEPARDGGLIIAAHGEGHFVYTGISFFRQLPAGVPGAYRLIANLLALSKNGSASND